MGDGIACSIVRDLVGVRVAILRPLVPNPGAAHQGWRSCYPGRWPPYLQPRSIHEPDVNEPMRARKASTAKAVAVVNDLMGHRRDKAIKRSLASRGAADTLFTK